MGLADDDDAPLKRKREDDDKRWQEKLDARKRLAEERMRQHDKGKDLDGR